MRLKSAGVLIAGILMLALVACGPGKLDMEKIKSSIQSGVSSQMGLKVDSVTCPGEVEAKAGSTFSCTVKTSDLTEELPVEITQNDDKGNVSWKSKYEVAPSEKVEDEVSSSLATENNIAADITCPPKVLKKKGYKFECKAKDSVGDTAVVKVEVTSDDGDIEWKLSQS